MKFGNRACLWIHSKSGDMIVMNLIWIKKHMWEYKGDIIDGFKTIYTDSISWDFWSFL